MPLEWLYSLPLEVLKTFDGASSGAYPRARLMQGLDGSLYGTTDQGGSSGHGTVFKLNRDGTGFVVLKHFENATTGGSLYAGLIQGTDGALYGTAAQGGLNGNGTIFKINPDGSGFAVLNHFDSITTGGNPYGGLMQGSDGALYGTATFGGSGGSGTVYKLNPDGSGFTVYPLNYWTTGGNPYGGLIEGIDGMLYGTASWGGSSGDGTVFKLNRDGTGATIIKNFGGFGPAPAFQPEGTFPYAGLVQAPGGALYGTAFYGGASGYGTVFKLNPDGSGYSVLHDFDGAVTGSYPSGWLILGGDGALYGTAAWGGTNGAGTVFSLNTDGSGFTLLHESFGTNFSVTGGYPYAGLVRANDGSLYGTANSGGSSDQGTVYRIRLNAPPVANAGADFSVNEGQLTALNGTLSNDADGDALAYAWIQLPGGTPVTLSDPNSSEPTLTSPSVPLGGETLSFELTVTAGGETSTDTVSINVVNVNHPPVAEAGLDQVIAEGASVTLNGEYSFDIDNDVFSFSWRQVDNGGPVVALNGADTAHPGFIAPVLGAGGAPGVVATLIFELRVDDGYAFDVPAPGFSFENVVDQVTVAITNVNNDPNADAGADQTVSEGSVAVLSGATSSDPDGDTVSFSWVQVGGPPVVLSGAGAATPSFTAPYVGAGGTVLEFAVTVNDGFGGTDSDVVLVHVQSVNDPPLASAAQPTIGQLWPPNHGLVSVGITGVSDPNHNATITVTAVRQDEATNGLGDGDTPVDAVINADGTVLLRAERSGNGDGRVYRIFFTASDAEGSDSGMVTVKVPHNVKKPAIDNGANFISTE